MSLLNVSGLAFHYASTIELFRDVTFAIDPGDRLALVGPNGAGKSSLLKLLAGELDPAAGAIIRRRGLRVACVEQETSVQTGDTALLDFVRSASDDPEDYAADARASRILDGLGFTTSTHALTLSQLSGGQGTRAALARALFVPSDILLLDEPTNHLDIAGREWLEAELERRHGACVLVSHDRTLLRRVATQVLEIRRGRVRAFAFGYDEYLEQQALLERQAWHDYQGDQRRVAAAEQASERRAQLAVRVAAPPAGVRTSRDFYARKAAKVARTARILKERATHAPRVSKPWVEQAIPDLDFSAVRRSGDLALSVRGLSKSFGDRRLFHDLTFQLARGQRLAILGANGSGKTTLLRILLGVETPDAGEVGLGAHVEVGYFSQDRAPAGDSSAPIPRTLLACLKVRPDRINRPGVDLSAELSPGERVKMGLARLLSCGANLLLLDEPTNHLEVEAQQALEQALLRFPGAVVVVSHDRSFLDSINVEKHVKL